MKYLKIIIPLIFFLLICFAANHSAERDKIHQDKLLHNNVKIHGIISSIKISGNHCFAVLGIKNVKSNFTIFNSNTQKEFFPYLIKNDKAEIYTHICENEIMIGDSIYFDSNNLMLKVFGKNQYELNVNLISEPTDIFFAKKNTQFPN
ncbi:hypothetical protein HYN48_13560 [Flavobacterium magnum]|uniref:DUF4369 domain-containing protein n=1 Tax=Flavobacterium magnum TaxID=2162713 RepID=A0A2S0RHD0_9FLAO|nr:hypothetical protein [Flavobacterium magnum]AWA31025.1 hypothetical protein HYN48_13560 [Flavobacterium magnum]